MLGHRACRRERKPPHAHNLIGPSLVATPACEAEAEPSPPPPRRTMLTRTPLLLLALCLGAFFGRAPVPAASEGGKQKHSVVPVRTSGVV